MLLREYGGHVRADFWRFYRASFDDFRARVGLRDLAVMATGLPPDSATLLAVNGGWTVTDHLMANVIDLLQGANWQRSKDGQRGQRQPKPFPRPGVKDPTKRTFKGASMSLADAGEWLASRRAKKQ